MRRPIMSAMTMALLNSVARNLSLAALSAAFAAAAQAQPYPTNGPVPQGSATAGQLGGLTQCATTTSAPTNATGKTNPLSCGTDGGLRVEGGVGGDVSTGSTDSGNPVKVGGVATSTTQTAVTAGQRKDLQTDLVGNLRSLLCDPGLTTPQCAIVSTFGDGSASTTNAVWTAAPAYAFNGIGFDRLRDTAGAATLGNTGTGTLAVEEAGRLYNNITSATTVTVKSGKGFLHTLTLNSYVASATVTIYDNAAGSGTKIATITLPSTITGLAPQTITYDLAFTTGLTVVTSGATDITVTYR
jgi:hypothetical protein